MNKYTLALGLITLLGIHASAQSGPVLDFSIGGQPADAIALTQDSGAWMLTQPVTLDGSTITNGQNGTLLTFDPDPSLNYGFGVANNTNTTQTYTLSFPQQYGSSPLAVNLPTGTYDVTASLAVTLSESDHNGATFSQSGSIPFQLDLLNQGSPGQTDVIDIGTGTLTIPSGSVSNQSQTFSFTEVENPSYYLASTGTTMSITTTFQLSPGDSASFSGSYTITAAPEPSGVSLGLLAGGILAGLLFFRHGKRA
jgi:hypothetical protein